MTKDDLTHLNEAIKRLHDFSMGKPPWTKAEVKTALETYEQSLLNLNTKTQRIVSAYQEFCDLAELFSGDLQHEAIKLLHDFNIEVKTALESYEKSLHDLNTKTQRMVSAYQELRDLAELFSGNLQRILDSR